MSAAPTLQSFIAGRWLGQHGAQALRSALDGHVLAYSHEERPDFAEAVDYARARGLASLMGMDFQQRAQRLKALALYLAEHKEQLYALSHHSGATRADSWIDIEGGNATLFSYAGIGSRELPSGNLVNEGPAIPLGKQGHFAGSHILVPRAGVAVHINAFNFPIWGMLEKFAPTFLAGMPCIVKPATSTSYLTEAVVRLMNASGLLPEGSLQLVIGSTGDLLDRLQGQDVVTFTGSADTAAKLRVTPNLIRNSVPFTAEADSLNCAILGPDVSPDSEEFDLYIKEVVREMTTKAGQKCTAIRRAIVPARHLDAVATRLRERLSKVVVGDPSLEGVRMGALASHDQQHDVGERVRSLLQSCDQLFGASDGFAPRGEGVAEGAFFAPTLLQARDPHAEGGAHDIEAFGPVSTLMAYDDLDEAWHWLPVAKAAWWRPWSPPTAAWPPRLSRWLLPGMADCWCSIARLPRSPLGTARRCRSSSTVARAAPVVVKSWVACVRSSTTCSAPPCKARRACSRRSPASTCAAAK